MKPAPIRLGYLPTRRTMFSREEARRYRDLVKRLIDRPDVDLVDIDGINDEGLIWSLEDVPAIIRLFRSREIDALFVPLCNFGQEGPVCEVVRAFQVPVLLWGPRDEGPDSQGLRLRDTQCGLFALGKVLQRYGVKFTYLTNTDPESDYFLQGYDRFIRVARVVRAVKTMRILQIGPRPAPFLSVTCNEGELSEKFGIEILPVSVSELGARMDAILAGGAPELTDLTEELLSGFCVENADPRCSAKKLAAMKLAFRELIAETRATCAAVQCWTDMQKITGAWPCAIHGILADEGFPVACETDIHGAISARMLQAAMGDTEPQFFADLTIRHPTNNNAELLWHCGPFPPSLAREGDKKRIVNHWTKENDCCGDLHFGLKKGDLTVCRFDGLNGKYSLFIGEGKAIDGPMNVGTYVWMEVGDWPKWEHQLVCGPYIHHMAGIYGTCAEVLKEACRYLSPLEPDPCQPDAAELDARWR